MKLLVVDWDYFFPSLAGASDIASGLYDWGCKETPFFINDVWMARTTGFTAHGLPLPSTSGEEVGFWDRVKFNPGCHLYYADSNAMAVTPRIQEGVTEVLLLDAHHDSGYQVEGREYSYEQLKKLAKAGTWRCDDWMILYYLVGASLKVYYPKWKTWAFEHESTSGLGSALRRSFDPGGPIEGVDRVFVCRSGAWVPPWLDSKFLEFLADAPATAKMSLEMRSLIRDWDETLVAQHAEAWKMLRELTAVKSTTSQD